MVINVRIEDEHLSRKLADLAKRQIIPCSKKALVHAILRAAVDDERGGPVDKWQDNVRRFTSRLNSPSQILPSTSDTVSDAEATDGPSPTSPVTQAAGQETPALPRKQKRRAG